MLLKFLIRTDLYNIHIFGKYTLHSLCIVYNVTLNAYKDNYRLNAKLM